MTAPLSPVNASLFTGQTTPQSISWGNEGGLNIWDYTLRQCLFTKVTSTVVSSTGSTNVSDYDLIS